jgi:hypothetical protein
LIRGDFEEELNEALAIGIKLLRTPYIGLAVPDRLRKNPQIYAEEVFATAEYNERFGNVVRTIVDRGVGEGTLLLLAKELTEQLDGPRPAGLSDRALIYGVYEYACTSGRSKYKRQIEKAFAESADGDLVAAHIVGVGMQMEQVANLASLERLGFAILVPKSRNPSAKIHVAIEKLLHNDEAKGKAAAFARVVARCDGPRLAVEKLLEHYSDGERRA